MHLETERLLIRDWRREDVEAAFSIYGDPEVMRYVGNGKPFESLDYMRKVIDRMIEKYRDQKLGVWAVELRETGELIGAGFLTAVPDGSDIEVGYHFGKPWWGNGYATETTKALVRYGFEEAGLNKIVGLTYPENIPSQRVLQKAGLTHEGQASYMDLTLEFFVLENSSAHWQEKV